MAARVTVHFAFASLFGLLIFKDAISSFGSIWSLDETAAFLLATQVWAALTVLAFSTASVLRFRIGELRAPSISALLFVSFWIWLLIRASLEGPVPAGFSFSVLAALAVLAVGASFSELYRRVHVFVRTYVLLSLVLSALVSIFGLGAEGQFGLKLFEFDYPLRGLASHSNVLAIAAAFGLIAEMTEKNALLKWSWRALFGITLGLTYSFGSSVALAASLGVIVVFWLLDPKKKRKGLILGLATLSLVATLFFLLLGQGRLKTVTDFTTGRIAIWEALLPAGAFELFFGSGLAFFRSTFPNNAHNDLLQALSIGGVVAVSLFVIAIGTKLVEISQLPIKKKQQIAAVMTFALTLGLVEVPMTPSFSVSFAIVLLLWLASPMENREEKLGVADS